MPTGEPDLDLPGDKIRRRTRVNALDDAPPPTRADLPFNLPTRGALYRSPRLVFAHYMTSWNASVDNKDPLTDPTEYARALWLPPGAVEVGKNHAVYGGFTRDRPDLGVTRPRRGAWTTLDIRDEVRAARAAGIDGFIVDILDLSPSGHWAKFLALLDAAQAVAPTDFSIVPMPDMTAGPGGRSTQLASDLLSVANHPSLHRVGGQLLITPYCPEAIGTDEATCLAYWSQFVGAMSSGGYPVALLGCYVNYWNGTKTAATLNGVMWGHGRWGDRDYAVVAGDTAGTSCHSTYSKPWMHYAAPGDSRPHVGSAYESYNTRTFRNCWAQAISSAAEIVQMTTWNDFSECSNVIPSANAGPCWLDLAAYYTTWLKTGTAPAIVRDGIYLSHRIHHSSVSVVSGPQTQFMHANQSPFVDKAEALCFLTAPADIQLTVCGTTTTITGVAAGLNAVYADLPPGVNGTVSVVAKRAGVAVPTTSLTSPYPVQAVPVSQDMTYRLCSSLRTGM